MLGLDDDMLKPFYEAVVALAETALFTHPHNSAGDTPSQVVRFRDVIGSRATRQRDLSGRYCIAYIWCLCYKLASMITPKSLLGITTFVSG